MYADGNVSSTINNVELSLSEKDLDHLKKFKSFLKTNKEVKISQVKYKDKVYNRCRLIMSDKHLKSQLIKLGCVPKKSTILIFPDEDIVPKSLINHFIRGYFDGDGCLSFTKTGRCVVQIIGTKEFLNGLQTIYPNTFKTLVKDKR